jgi:acylaminoacyl-peptidase
VLDRVGGLSLGRPYDGGSYSVSRNGRVAYTHCTPYRPADVYLAVPGRADGAPLTQLNEDLLAQRELGTVEAFEVPSSFDGRPVQGWIVRPPRFDASQSYPLLLEIHGGPFANYGDRFALEMQLYAAAGHVVVYTNPRGSTSYGEEFANLIHHAYPSQDYDDLMSCVDAVIARGSIDASRLYVTGGSGGGVLTAWIVGKTDRFRAAVVAKPVIHWTSFALTADLYPFFVKYWFPGMPWEVPEQYWERSPLSLVGNVSTPTMVLTGESDWRTPISESEQYYQALKLRGVDTALVRIPEASHGITDRPSRFAAKTAYVLEWFARHSD